MTENMEAETTRANLANLTKIPATEFEKHFHEWMERDDVARGLQAKLRCDLIKNFNKTNLGKQMMAHTMSSTGGSTYRLALTPLVLALNTLVAEFLYAQNCHFTLSVFCTEIPFRNTLPDFDSMRHFRFTEREINDIWEAVTGTAASKRCLDATILDEYETNPQTSLLLLFLKSLLEMKPLEMLRKSVEIQTECEAAAPQEKCQRSTFVQATQEPPPVKPPAKSPDNLRHLNKYLLILSQKVNEMTQEFELLVKQRNLQKPAVKTTRSRELYTLNRSLDRINENFKQLTKSRHKGKRLTSIVESIDGLTKQFGKCAENFGQVTKELSKREKQQTAGYPTQERTFANSRTVTTTTLPAKSQPPKVKFDEKQTETEALDKTYADWIYEMRTTDNGKRFLERVENSLSKAVAKRKEQWQNEADAKLKEMKSLMKLHYKQKMLTHLSRQGSDDRTNEVHKLNESVENRLKQFELKQLELVEKLRESSFELQEAQKQLHEQREECKESHRRDDNSVLEINEGVEPQKGQDHEKVHENVKRSGSPQTPPVENQLVNDKSKETAVTQNQLEEIMEVVTPRDFNVDRIITDAKLRLQQLETESNCLEQHFQIYLERRKQEHLSRQQSTHMLIAQSQQKTSEIFRNFADKEKAIADCLLQNRQSKPSLTEDDLDFDVEFLRLKEKLKETQVQVEAAGNSSSSSSSIELKTNAILEAKHKFFEDEELFRKRKEKELMQLNAMASLEEQMEMSSSSMGPFSYNHENVPRMAEKDQIIVFNINSNVSNEGNTEPEVRIAKNPKKQEDKDNLKTAFACDTNNKSPRRELFPKELSTAKDIPKLVEIVRYHEPISVTSRDLRKTLKDLKTYTQNMEKHESRTAEGTAELIKQSMAKMKQIFGQQSNEETEEAEPNEITPPMALNESADISGPDIQDLNQTTSTSTPTSHATTTTISTTSASVDSITKRQFNMLESLNNLPAPSSLVAADLVSKGHMEMLKSASLLNRISKTSVPSLLNLTSDSEESLKSEHKENKISGNEDDDDAIGDISCESDMAAADRNPIPELLITPKGDSLEIGEILSEPQAHQFAPVTEMTSNESSDHTDTESEQSSRGRADKKLTAKTSDESESDFWA